MGRRFGSILGLIHLVMLGWASSAAAYPTPVDFDGSLMRWPLGVEDGAVSYEVQADEIGDLDQYAEVIEEAAAIWSHVGGSYVFYQKAQEGEVAKVTVKLVRLLKNGDFASGYTTFDGRDREGHPTHSSIYIHVSDSYSFNGVAKTILHELGHGLGLGHTLIPEAIMSYSLEKNRFGIDTDDEAAIARLYPADGTKPRLAPGCAVGALGRESESDSHIWVELFLLTLPILGILSRLTQPIASMRSIERLALRRMSSETETSY